MVSSHGKRYKVKKNVSGSANTILIAPEARFDNFSIKVTGNANKILIGRSVLAKGEITVLGNSCLIVIGDACRLSNISLFATGAGAKISIGDKTTVEKASCATYEGKQIEIGADCMLGVGIVMCTSDIHSILDEKDKRINPAKDIVIGDHVWIGRFAQILKGARIGSGSIVGTCAVVTKPFDEKSCVIAGCPAKEIQENVHWVRELV